MVFKSIVGVTTSFLVVFSLSTNAAPVSGQGTWETTLQGRDLDGNPDTIEAYYDTVLDITWLADANYALTSGYENGGRMTWADANTWAAELNISGISGWRLPRTVDIGNDGCNWSVTGGTDCGYNVDTATSELAHIYYNVLGNLAYFDTEGNSPQPGWGLTNTGPFTPGGNVEPNIYWSATDATTVPLAAWGFEMRGGRQDIYDNYRSYFAWAVHDDDVGRVTIDIKPSKKPTNVIDLKKDKFLKVAIVGNADFDALQVDPLTVRFGPSKASAIRYKGRDYNRDGYSDLLLTFKLKDTGIVDCTIESATLTGQTLTDPIIHVAGSDSLTVESCP